MAAITIEEAQASLPDLIHRLAPGEEMTITENDRAIARLVAPPVQPPLEPRRLGSLRGTVLHVADDFDAPLDDMKEYME